MLQQVGRVQHAPEAVHSGSSLPRRIVALGGGTGLPAVLRSLRLMFGGTVPEEAITAIVAVTDDGGSSGRLRSELRIPPPGDVRNCVAALADDGSPLARLLQHRFSGGEFDGHPLGNVMLAALTQQMNGDFASAVRAFERIVGSGGRVLPATAQDVHLKAECESGEVVIGETAISNCGMPIRKLGLEQRARPLPEAIEALVNADVIIVGPGSLYTSILPVLMVDGVAPTMYGVNATRIYVANLMTEPGATDGFSLERHLEVIDNHVGLPLFDYVLVNDGTMPEHSLARYARNCAHPIRCDSTRPMYGSSRIIRCNLTWEIEEGKLRHDPVNLASALSNIIQSARSAQPAQLAS